MSETKAIRSAIKSFFKQYVKSLLPAFNHRIALLEIAQAILGLGQPQLTPAEG